MNTNMKWVTRSANKKPVLNEGWYIGKLMSIVPSSSNYGENLHLKFQVDGGLKGTVTFLTFSAKSLFPGNKDVNPSKLFEIACAILGKKLNEGEVISADNLIEKYCSVKITDAKKDDRQFQKISSFKELSQEQIESLRVLIK